MELAVLRRLRRGVADQVIGARIGDDLFHRDGQVVAVDDRAAVGLISQHAQRILRLTQCRAAALHADVLVDVEFAGGQPARIDRVE